MATKLENVIRCEAQNNGVACESAIFYDWGLQIMLSTSGQNALSKSGKFAGYATSDNVKICARCTTPYINVDGSLVDISDDLSAEDVKLILSRGQATLPHVKIKDP